VSDNRRFHSAILASLVLHALVLFSFPDMVDTARRAASIPPQIIARLMEPEPAPAPVPEKPLIEKPQPPQAVQKPKPKPRPKREPVITAPAPAAPAAPPPPMTEPSPALTEPAPPVAAIEPQPAAPQQAPEALWRDQYRVQLIDEARRHKRYPPLARENNWQGDVLVAVAVGANGRAAVSLRTSSGYEVLDRQALEMFRQAARAVPVPPALRGKEFALEVRAVYNLED
jgi:protein TonB